MNTALQIAPREPLAFTQEQVTIARNTVAKGLDDDQFAVFVYNCQRQGVHPLDGLVVPVLRKDDDGNKKLTFVTTIDMLRSRAAETDEYAGSDDAVFEYKGDDKKPISAVVTVWRFVQGQKCSFTATARYDEYYPGDKQGFMWRSKPHVMLGKCAEGLAIRKAFPKQLAGLYLEEELAKDNTTPKRPAKPQPPAPTVKCSECNASGGHLPKCSKRAPADQPDPKPDNVMCSDCGVVNGHEATCKHAPKATNGKPTTRAVYMILEVVEKKTKKQEPYLVLDVVNPQDEHGKLYVWHRSMYEYLTPAKGKSMMCEVSAEVKDDKTFYQLENILEIAGQSFVNNAPAQQGALTEQEDF